MKEGGKTDNTSDNGMFREGNGFSVNNYNAAVGTRLKLTGENRARRKKGEEGVQT